MRRYKIVNIAGQPVYFKLDTASQANIIPIQTFNKIQGAILRTPSSGLNTYSGYHIEPQGETSLPVEDTRLTFSVVKRGGAILGNDACQQLGIIARIDAINITGNNQDDARRANETINTYNDVFSGLGLIKTAAHLHIDKTVEPTIDAPRRIPIAI